MAVLKNALIAASVLASTVYAVPMAGIHKREVVMSTATVTDWVTVSQQATVWVDDAGKPVRTDIPSGANVVTVEPTTPTTTFSSSTTSSAPPPPPSSSTTTAAPSPTYSPANFVPSAAPAPSPAPTTTASLAPAAPAPSSTQLAAKQAAGFAGEQCVGQGSGCSGDITHYDGGLGACGWNVNTASDMQIALPYALMGTQSNGNPYCGKSLTIQGPSGNLVQATVGDKCMGCEGYSIDLTDALFSAVAPSGDGRVHNINWWFN